MLGMFFLLIKTISSRCSPFMGIKKSNLSGYHNKTAFFTFYRER